MARFAFMIGLALLMLAAAAARAAVVPIDFETAAKIYQQAAMREQVRASLGVMPAHLRQMIASDKAAHLSDQQLDAVTEAAKRGFRIDVFEAPALNALAANLDAASAKKISAFLEGDLGRRMVAADVATAMLPEPTVDQIMSGELTAPTTPQREALFAKLEHASRSTESTVQIFLSMGQAVAIGTAVGAGRDRSSMGDSARKTTDADRLSLEQNMREPLRRYMAYSYRDMSDADLKHLLSFLESAAGKRYVAAYIASLGAGYEAMGRRCGEQLGESLRELAQAQLDVPMSPPPAIAAPVPAPVK
jgi:hypothetical protein